MITLQDAKRQISTLMETQVLVAGGGPAGIAAAVASARTGAKTVILEASAYFGGNITQCGVESGSWFRFPNTLEAGGVFQEVEDSVHKLSDSFYTNLSEMPSMDAELFKVVADQILLSSGVTPVLHCTVVDAILDDRHQIRGVVIQSKSGRQAVYAQRVIDCTGDADVAAFAGAPFVQGSKGNLMSVTPVFHVMGVNTARFLNYIKNDLRPTYRDWGECWNMQLNSDDFDLFTPCIRSCFQQAVHDGLLPDLPDIRFGGSYGAVTKDGCVSNLNIVLIGNIDCTDVLDLTKAEMLGREHAMMALKALRRYMPGFETARIQGFSAKIGARESRRISGQYFLTGTDVLNECRFAESIGIIPEFLDGRGLLILPTSGRYIQIPYKALLPQKVGNLLVAGRCISGDEIAHCAFRSIICCFVTGQGAGVAAAISILDGVSTQNVKVEHVQSVLLNQNVRVF